jgi:type IV secretory pathway TrbL component
MTYPTNQPPPYQPPPYQPAAPVTGPVGVVANVIGLCAAAVAWWTPAVSFAPLGAIGATAVVLAIVAGTREAKTPVLGLLGGLGAVLIAVQLQAATRTRWTPSASSAACEHERHPPPY